MSGPRQKKVAAALRAELADLIATSVKDPRVAKVGLLTVTEVRLTPDLRVAEVSVSFVADDDAACEAAVAALRRAAGFLRGEAGRRLRLKRAPELRFVCDRGAEFGAYIDEVRRQDREGGGE